MSDAVVLPDLATLRARWSTLAVAFQSRGINGVWMSGDTQDSYVDPAGSRMDLVQFSPSWAVLTAFDRRARRRTPEASTRVLRGGAALGAARADRAHLAARRSRLVRRRPLAAFDDRCGTFRGRSKFSRRRSSTTSRSPTNCARCPPRRRLPRRSVRRRAAPSRRPPDGRPFVGTRGLAARAGVPDAARASRGRVADLAPRTRPRGEPAPVDDPSTRGRTDPARRGRAHPRRRRHDGARALGTRRALLGAAPPARSRAARTHRAVRPHGRERAPRSARRPRGALRREGERQARDPDALARSASGIRCTRPGWAARSCSPASPEWLDGYLAEPLLAETRHTITDAGQAAGCRRPRSVRRGGRSPGRR